MTTAWIGWALLGVICMCIGILPGMWIGWRCREVDVRFYSSSRADWLTQFHNERRHGFYWVRANVPAGDDWRIAEWNGLWWLAGCDDMRFDHDLIAIDERRIERSPEALTAGQARI